MGKYHIPFWKEAPFIRISIPFIIGIAVGYYFQTSILAIVIILTLTLTLYTLYSLANIEQKFRYRYLIGLNINVLVASTGGMLALEKNPYNNANLPALTSESTFVVSLKEPLIEKKATWKALCRMHSIQQPGKAHTTYTDMILYIRKETGVSLPSYGNRITFRKPPEKIKNFVEGSSFDYERYCALKNIHYQVFLRPEEYIILPGTEQNFIIDFLFDVQASVLAVLRKNITNPKECGLAEALLIGYKNDLDKNLMQAYSNTGVVHVVAISGLHLGLIYSMLNIICKPFRKRIIRAAVILFGLWMFSLLAGGSPSIIRSAVMFSVIVTGEIISGKSAILNNLAVSAFILLTYDPYWLWDLGFILSYTALLSIVLFMKPLYHLYTAGNRWIDYLWKMNAVTLSAQILTIPVLLYCFQQFPNLFIITNLIAIPLSSIILIGEITMCMIHFIEPVAKMTGRVLGWLIRIMNGTVECVNEMPFATTKNINISLSQVALIYLFILFASDWLMYKHKSWR